MKVRLVIIAPPKSRKSYAVRLPLVVGRGDEAKFRIPQDSVSRRHCEFARDGGVVTVTDLDSTNGTIVDGRRIEPHTATAVASGAEVRIGSAVLRVEYVAPAVAAAVVPHDADMMPSSGVDTPDDVADPPKPDPVAETAPELEAAEATTAGAAANPAFPEVVAAADASALPEAEPAESPADLDALEAAEAAEAAAPPADGSFDFLASDAPAPPAADDKLDDFFKSLS